MVFYYASGLDAWDHPGSPVPAVGHRVVFAFEKLVAARIRRGSISASNAEEPADGLTVVEDPREVLQWPCRLWRVTDLEGVARPYPDTAWLRCKAFTVEEELPSWMVFGPHGAAVVSVIEQAEQLSTDQVTSLARLDGGKEAQVYAQVWSRHAANRQSGRLLGSRGLSPVFDAVERAARHHGPSNAFAWDPVDEVEVLADPAWVEASHAALAAGMGLGAPEACSRQERTILLTRWLTVHGDGLL